MIINILELFALINEKFLIFGGWMRKIVACLRLLWTKFLSMAVGEELWKIRWVLVYENEEIIGYGRVHFIVSRNRTNGRS